MNKALKEHIEYLLGVKVRRMQPVSGGDISEAYLLEAETERFFCKINYDDRAHDMFKAEKAGLQAIAQSKTINVPKVLLCEPLEKGGFLVMDHIEPKRPTEADFEALGHQLAALHRQATAKEFGFPNDNFIGSLPQSNSKHALWSDFYVQERLLPQLKLAIDTGKLTYSEIPTEEGLIKGCSQLFPHVTPSLLHGDLWSGNYLISAKGAPYLIDPAVYYGHYEVDMAMTRLFGGFGPSFYRAYQEHFPPVGHEKERNDIYQLYYLLVHLNLFGSSYKASVTQILDRYF
ncbi:fructosamine kinase family protein [Pseudozobellia thermophila]|uniref:Fructosamine-3-kinase n=1 Tax=Pseudozobellia thermophila TaxID=192903 RepID=A0A1M6BGD7_9FLAO|nr:fructosamine kinase family protein [Pseudozobellia thermophila]SHI47769.1 Fructosamine-3-kinase [Pseudozobellia thermophila]